MKKLMMLIVVALFAINVSAQEKLYLVFEFMQVDNEQETTYMETEEFWEKIHQERVKNGDIIGWDLWSLQPGGENQHFQYLTVNLYDDPVKMMSGEGDFEKALEQAYPNLSDEELLEKFNQTASSRDLAVRIYLEMIDKTDGEDKMPIGTVASIDLMKVNLGNYSTYEKAETEIFKPMHQTQVDNGLKESWGLLRFISPIGSDTYASHITVNMYTDYNQYFMDSPESEELSDSQIEAIEDGIATRDLKFVYMATLIRKAR